MTFIRIAEFDWLPAQHDGNILENYINIVFSETILRMKLFLLTLSTAFVAMATYSCIDL